MQDKRNKEEQEARDDHPHGVAEVCIGSAERVVRVALGLAKQGDIDAESALC